VTDWKPLSGRLGLVASGPTTRGNLSVPAIYKAAFGVDAQNFQQAPNPLLPSIAQGSKAGMTATCSLAANRVDFNLSPANPSGSISGPTLQLIDNPTFFYSELLHIATSICDGSVVLPNEFDRATIFIQLASIELDVETANRALVRVIPEQYRPKLQGEEAFALQINNPKTIESGGESLRLNFLTKWSVEQFQVITFGMATGGVPSGMVHPNMLQPQIQTFVGACVTFDCNVLTSIAPKNALLDRDQQHATFLAGLNLISGAQRDFGLDIKGFPSDKKAD